MLELTKGKKQVHMKISIFILFSDTVMFRSYGMACVKELAGTVGVDPPDKFHRKKPGGLR